MSYINNHNSNTNVTLEWAYMIGGILAVVISTTLIFGSNTEVNQSMNIVMAVALIGFIIYSSSTSKKLKNSISVRENQAAELQSQLQRAAEELGNLRFEIKEKKLQIETLRREISDYHIRTESLQETLAELQEQLNRNEE
jgi:peptidoglycan hydrolase CwlO-like protein